MKTAEKEVNSSALVYNGQPIRDRGEMMALTDMWRACGSVPHQKPADWLRDKGSQAFIDYVADREKVLPEHLLRITKGRNGETWAHWQIGMAYAKHISHEFHMWCNQVVRERMEAEAVPRGLSIHDPEVRQIIGGIVKACMGVVMKEAIERILPAMLSAKLAEQSFLLRRGETAKQIWDRHGLPGKIRGSSVWFGNRLKEMGCSIEGEARFDRGSSAIRLFDPDRAALCMKNGLRGTAEIYAKERQGQGKLRLVP